MIKVLSFTARKPGETRAAFERYWDEVHVPMWRDIEGIRGYIVSRILAVRERPDVSPLAMGEPDGVVELWYDDEAAMARSAGSPAGQAWRRDSAIFIGGMRSFLTREEASVPVAAGPRPRTKALSIIAGPHGRDRATFVAHWREVHAPMARTVPGVRGFVLSHPIRDLVRADIPAIAMGRAPDGFAATYADDRDALDRLRRSPEAARWFADGASFLGAIRTFIAEEQVVVLPPAAPELA